MKTQVTQINYERKFNLGDYNSETLGIVISLGEGADPAKVFKAAKTFVESRGEIAMPDLSELKKEDAQLLFTEVETATQDEAQSMVDSGEAEIPQEAIVDAPKKARKPRATKAEMEQRKAATVETTEAEKTVSEVVESPKTETEAPKKVKKIQEKAYYNRDIEGHKQKFTSILNSIDPNWKKNAERAQKTSVAMIGKLFLDDEGIILPDFRAEVESIYFGKA